MSALLALTRLLAFPTFALAYAPSLPRRFGRPKGPLPRSSRVAMKFKPEKTAPIQVKATLPAREDPRVSLFNNLLAQECGDSAIGLKSTDGGKSLVATKNVSAGDVLVTVPKRLVVSAHRSGVVSGLQGQTEEMWKAAGDLRKPVEEANFTQGARWDARLALGVYEALAGAGGDFWDVYRRLLPTPPQVTHPLMLPDSFVQGLQNDMMEIETIKTRERLVELYPDLDKHDAHPSTEDYFAAGRDMQMIPKPLQYCYALVNTRCFDLDDGDTFGLVPFLDMADHSPIPSANFETVKDGYGLVALRPIQVGEDVTISYGDKTTSKLFRNFGFSPEEGTAQDSKWLTELAAAAYASGAPGLEEALSEYSDFAYNASRQELLNSSFDNLGPLATPERRAAIMGTLVRRENVSSDLAAKILGKDEDEDASVPPIVLLIAAGWQLSQYPTSLRKDQTTLAGYLADEVADDKRIIAMLKYRIARKILLNLAVKTISIFLSKEAMLEMPEEPPSNESSSNEPPSGEAPSDEAQSDEPASAVAALKQASDAFSDALLAPFSEDAFKKVFKTDGTPTDAFMEAFRKAGAQSDEPPSDKPPSDKPPSDEPPSDEPPSDGSKLK